MCICVESFKFRYDPREGHSTHSNRIIGEKFYSNNDLKTHTHTQFMCNLKGETHVWYRTKGERKTENENQWVINRQNMTEDDVDNNDDNGNDNIVGEDKQ